MDKVIAISEKEYRDKVYACWLGKNIGGTLGATMGIVGGTKGIPAKWSKPIGDKIVLHKFTRVPDAPETIGELTERTVRLDPGEAKDYPVNTQAGTCLKCHGWIGDCLCRRPRNNIREQILFLGNSITWHGPKADIDWFHDWGMAASALKNDYVHVLIKSISEITGKKPEMLVKNIADFERNYDTYDIDNNLKECFNFKADLVILAIGENVPPLISEKSKTKLKAAMARLLTALKKNSNPTIFVRSCFWPDKTKDKIMKQACSEIGGIYVDISGLSKDESNYARAERTFTHSGVGSHPGDKGMEAIATALLDAIKKIR